MTALTTIATPRRHTNVLQHMVGYFKASPRFEVASGSCSLRSRTTGARSCRSSFRSRCCGTMYECTTCRILPDSSISSRIRRS